MALIEAMLTAVDPRFVRVMGSVDDEPSGVFANWSRVGESWTTVPRPLSAVVCGLELSLSETVSFPVLFPVPDGVNVTQMLQDAVQLPSALCGFRSVPAEQKRAAPVEQSTRAVQLVPVTENCGLLLEIESIVSGVGREL